MSQVELECITVGFFCMTYQTSDWSDDKVDLFLLQKIQRIVVRNRRWLGRGKYKRKD